MSLLLNNLTESWPAELWRDVPVLVAVSGGADSVALLASLALLRSQNEPSHAGPLIAAHFDHQIRPESAEDAAFVENLAARWDVPCLVGAGEPGTLEDEASARKARYAFFRQAAFQTGARYLAIAHTADDQAETILHRLLRGASLRGVSGIPRSRRLTEMTTIVRPLLGCSRADIIEFLQSHALDWRDDPSNRSGRYTRNRIRHELLPLLEASYNPRVRQALLRFGLHASRSQAALETDLEALLERCTLRVDHPTLWELDCVLLREAGAARMVAVFQLLWRRSGWPEQAMDTAAWNRLCETVWGVHQLPFEMPGQVRVAPFEERLQLTRDETALSGSPSTE
jgi:tRNA(Ile)-lysidine synthase